MTCIQANVAELPFAAQALIPHLRRMARGHLDCFAGNKSLARAIGCCERTVQIALKALASAGLVEVVKDYALKTQRRIKLLFLGQPSERGAKNAPPGAQNLHPQGAQNLRPELEKSGAEKEAEAAPPPPLSSPSVPADEDRVAVAETDVAEITPRLMTLCGVMADARLIEGRVRALLARWGREWLLRALERAETRARAGGLMNPLGYLQRTLEGFQADGGPPPAPSAAAATAEKAGFEVDPEYRRQWAEKQAREQEANRLDPRTVAARIRAMIGGGKVGDSAKDEEDLRPRRKTAAEQEAELRARYRTNAGGDNGAGR